MPAIQTINRTNDGTALGLDHALNETCPCQPIVGATYKKNGSGYSQYSTTKVITHNPMPASATRPKN
jgi:hypothetical protein